MRWLYNLLKELFSKNGKKAIDNLDSLDTKFDINLTTLRNDLRGVDNRTLTDLYNKAYDSTADLIKISLERDNLKLFDIISASGSITAADNTAGFEVSLNKAGRPFVNVYYKVGGAAEIYVEVSVDGATWRLLDKIVTPEAREGVEQFPWIVYPYIRVRTPTTGIDVEFEIVASR